MTTEGEDLMKGGIWVVGGLCAGIGLLFLIGGFGDTGFGLMSGGSITPAALSFMHFGYDASMDVGITSNGIMGFGLIIAGIALMVKANAGAWKHTGGEY